MRVRTSPGMLAALACLAGAFAVASPAGAQGPYRVGTTADGVDVAPGDGVCATAAGLCSLRAAVQETNALPGLQVIVLPAGTYTLAAGQPAEDLAAEGDLDLRDDVELRGAGARRTVIRATADTSDRILEVHQDVTAKINNVTLTGGFADEGGGNILNHGSLTLFNVTVSNGFTTIDGGGILSTSGGVLSLRRTTVSGNVAIFGGGGIATAGRLELSNSTVSGNGATFEGTGLGGGIRVVGPLLVSVVDSTIADNFAATGGSAVSVDDLGGRGVVVRNSILAGRPGNGVAACEGTGIQSLGWNLATDASCRLTRPTDLRDTDPALGALTDNGGPTDTHLPAATSPAVDTGTADRCPPTDQRGLLRPLGAACDRGSVEHQPPT